MSECDGRSWELQQELMHAYWSDLNLSAATVRVSHKPDGGWTPKAYNEREIPVPTKLVKSLRAWKAKSDKTCRLVFPTAGRNPKLDFLDCPKAVAERAKLDQTPSGCTSFEPHLRRGASGLKLICAPCGNGWVTQTSKAQCAISSLHAANKRGRR